MRPGDLVLVAPCSSKADQFGEEHCPFPSVIEYDGTSTCAAAALRDIELERPCSGAARASTPLFARADGQPSTTIPPPLLTAGDRVKVKWGERWFHGTFTSSRRGLGYDGKLTRIYRIWYDGASGWRPQSKWHDLASEEWQRS